MTDIDTTPMRLRRMRFKPSTADQIRVRFEDNISEAIRNAITQYANGAELPAVPAREHADTALALFIHDDVLDKAKARAKAEGRRLPDVVSTLLLAEGK